MNQKWCQFLKLCLVILAPGWVIVAMMSLANRALVGHGSSHWSESQIFHVNDIQAELICDANGRILAAVQPDDGGSWVLYGQTRIAEGVYVDMESAKKAGEKLRFDCPAIPKGMEGIP